jgi:hypothetical protein
MAIGVLVIGRLAVGRAAIKHAKTGKLEVDELLIRRITRPDD